MADDNRKGAELAAQDFPHNRLASRALGQLAKNGFGLIPGSQAREAEFRDGYRDTHRAMASDAVRVVRTQAASSPSTATSLGGSMTNLGQRNGNSLSVATQVALLEALKAYLERFDQGLSDVTYKYGAQMDALDGVMVQEAHSLLVNDHMEPTCAGIRRVQDWITTGSVPVLNAQISHFGVGDGQADDLGGPDQADLSRSASHGNERTWQGQIDLLYEFKAFLGRLEVSLSLFQVNYRQKVAGLEAVMQDAHAEFVEHQMEPTIAMIQNLREFIAENSVPTVMGIIQQIESRPSL